MKRNYWSAWTTKLGFLFFVYGFLYLFISFFTVRAFMPELFIPSAIWIFFGYILGLAGFFSKEAARVGLWADRHTAWRAGLLFIIVAMYFPLVNLPHLDKSNLSFSLTANTLGSLVYFIIGVFLMLIGWYLGNSSKKPAFWKAWTFKLGMISIVYSYTFFVSVNRNVGAILPGYLVYSLLFSVLGIVLISGGILFKTYSKNMLLWEGRNWSWRLGFILIIFMMLFSICFALFSLNSITNIIIFSSYHAIRGILFMIAGGITLPEPPPERLGIWRNRPWPWRWGILIISYALLILLINLVGFLNGNTFLPSIFYWLFASFGIILIFFSRGRPKALLVEEKIGLWEKRPDLWKVGIVLIIFDIANSLMSLFFGSIIEDYGTLETIIGRFLFSIIGIILMAISVAKRGKSDT